MDRRIMLKGGTALIVTAATAAAATVSGAPQAAARPAAILPDDARFMQLAIDEAARAHVGFGAVIVKDGTVLATGHNRTGPDRDPTAHGEMVAIRAALAAHGPDALKGATLYTSAEPCCMCMGAIIWCEMGRLVYAAALADLTSLFGQIDLSAQDVAAKAPFAPVDIAGPVLREAALELFK